LPRKRQVARGVLDLLAGLPLFATAPLCRHWHLRWGATDAEVGAPMAGDDSVTEASFNATRAITIGAPPGEVWPWIVQMGYGRAGFYTYDLVDNGGYPSADDVREEYQKFAVGDWAFNMNSLFGIELPLDETNAFRVGGFGIGEWLLWEKPGSTWSWLLKPLPDGKTRLVLRIRAHPGNLFWTLFMEFGDPPMARRMLKGIKARAEKEPELSGRRHRPAPNRSNGCARGVQGHPHIAQPARRLLPQVRTRSVRL
jgi:hypothetical protein